MMKRKLIAPMVALLLCVGMVSVGFATWVITKQGEDSVSDGDFTVYPVENNSIEIEISLSDNSINFGAKEKKAGVSGNWLTFSNGNENTPEDLNATLVVTITNWSELKDTTDKQITLDLSNFAVNGAADGWNNGTNNNEYIVLPANQTVTVKKTNGVWGASTASGTLTDAVDSDAGTVTIPLTFDWGSKSGNENPVDYFNTLENNQTNRGLADAFLKMIQKLDNATYSLKVTASVTKVTQ